MRPYHDCMEVREDFSAYLDGELATDEREGLEAHLTGCADCLRELDTMKRVDDAYRAMPPVNAPAGFEADVREVVRTGRLASAPAPRPVPRWMGPLVAMATAAGVLIVGMIVFEVRQESQPDMQMAGAPLLESADDVAFFNSAPAAPAPEASSAPDQGPAGGGEAWQSFARAPESAPAPVQEAEKSEAKAKTGGAWDSFARAPASAADTAVATGREDNQSALTDSLAAAGVSAEADTAGADEDMRERAEVIGAPPAEAAADAPARAEASAPAMPEIRAGVGEVVSRRVLRSFKVRADGAWVESGYAGEPTTELKRGSAVLNQVMQRHATEEWDTMLDRPALQIFQLDGTWYSLEGKPAESN